MGRYLPVLRAFRVVYEKIFVLRSSAHRVDRFLKPQILLIKFTLLLPEGSLARISAYGGT